MNVNGVLFTAQAAGQQMERFENGGSIILVASMSGSITNKVRLLLEVAQILAHFTAGGGRHSTLRPTSAVWPSCVYDIH